MIDNGSPAPSLRVRADGKFFRLGGDKWLVKGFTYGPFAPRADGRFLPDDRQVRRDFAHMRRLGANAIRLYHAPPRSLLDAALEHELRVLIDLPWDKHRCFFEDWAAQEDARRRVREVARTLGGHPAVFAISVANEIPNDIVRFYGHQRVERFVDELLDAVKQESPECLTCFGNFPTTEFLNPTRGDFHCFNVYLHDPDVLGRYLDRLQHIAGNKPLLLGEYGLCSMHEGESEQAGQLAEHIHQVFGHGLAGSFVFSYTDDWFTGGHRIEDWELGVTRRDRSEKEAARGLQELWSDAPFGPERRGGLPPVSVVVCSHNGAATLEECLQSLLRLDYPDYEVILVDDGSTDETPAIAARFPQITSIRQPNRGLSFARNVGAETARGEIVAYTDSDCVVHEDWLLHLVHSMQAQQVDVIGGPNISPPSDRWVAKCVAASPGNPSHVMLDDQRAEHVPGCNMAFRRDRLLALGGFDPQFRAAGDDVDMCWRFLDAGLSIGYAPGAMVWHHRRGTARAFYKQQRGYARSEAMLQFKHPHRFTAAGCSRWNGVIYGEGAVGLPILTPRIYYGQHGSALFQAIYRDNRYTPWTWVTTLEWHAVALCAAVLSVLVPPLLFLSAVLWGLTVGRVVRCAWKAPLPAGAPFWCRPLIALFHLGQPVVRGGHRVVYRLRHRQAPPVAATAVAYPIRRLSANQWDLYLPSKTGLGRETLLKELVGEASRARWKGDFAPEWTPWDAELIGDRWHNVTIRTVTEELGWPQRFTRVRWSAHASSCQRLTVAAAVLWTALAAATQTPWAAALGLVGCGALLVRVHLSRRACLRAVGQLIGRAADRAGFRTAAPPPALVTADDALPAEQPVLVQV